MPEQHQSVGQGVGAALDIDIEQRPVVVEVLDDRPRRSAIRPGVAFSRSSALTMMLPALRLTAGDDGRPRNAPLLEIETRNLAVRQHLPCQVVKEGSMTDHGDDAFRSP